MMTGALFTEPATKSTAWSPQPPHAFRWTPLSRLLGLPGGLV